MWHTARWLIAMSRILIDKISACPIFCFTRYAMLRFSPTFQEIRIPIAKLSIISSLIIILLSCIFLQLLLYRVLEFQSVWQIISGNYKFHRECSRIFVETTLYKITQQKRVKKCDATLHHLSLCINFLIGYISPLLHEKTEIMLTNMFPH